MLLTAKKIFKISFSFSFSVSEEHKNGQIVCLLFKVEAVFTTSPIRRFERLQLHSQGVYRVGREPAKAARLERGQMV